MTDQEAEGARAADELAAEFGRNEEQNGPPEGTAPEEPRQPSRLPWIVATVCFAIVLLQIPALRASLTPRASIRSGVQELDAQAEACVDTLWTISALVQEGEPADALARLPFAEPITRAAYAISIDDDDEIVVACPNPAAHGLKRLQITESNPIPEAQR